MKKHATTYKLDKPKYDQAPLAPGYDSPETERTRRDAKLRTACTVRLWESLQVKCPGFFSRSTAKKRNREELCQNKDDLKIIRLN